MGIFEKKKENALSGDSAAGSKTYIQEGICFVGDFFCEEPIEILGTVEGRIESTVDVHIAKGGLQQGSMEVENLYVDGTVDSEIVCRNTASFSMGSTFKGEVTTVNIEANRGSNFSGKLNLVSPDVNAGAKKKK